jgi:hypothetical protein
MLASMVDQMSLFNSPEPVRMSTPAAPVREEPTTLEAMAYLFLQGRPKVAAVRACRNCRCTEEHPCQLSGDQCILNHRTGYCSAYACVKAYQRSRGGQYARVA